MFLPVWISGCHQLADIARPKKRLAANHQRAMPSTCQIAVRIMDFSTAGPMKGKKPGSYFRHGYGSGTKFSFRVAEWNIIECSDDVNLHLPWKGPCARKHCKTPKDESSLKISHWLLLPDFYAIPAGADKCPFALNEGSREAARSASQARTAVPSTLASVERHSLAVTLHLRLKASDSSARAHPDCFVDRQVNGSLLPTRCSACRPDETFELRGLCICSHASACSTRY